MSTKTWSDMSGGIFDSRDVIDRLAELEDADDLDEFDAAELATLRDVREQGESAAADWQYGAAFIPDAEFEDYARELAEDIGAIPSDYSLAGKSHRLGSGHYRAASRLHIDRGRWHDVLDARLVL